MTHVKAWNLGRHGAAARSALGFSMMELLVVVAITGILAGAAVAVTPTVLKMAKGESNTTHMKSFLSRNRELAISRRRNISITFTAPDRLVATEMPIPGVTSAPGTLYTDQIQFEGGLEYLTFAGVPDTPDAFGMIAPVTLGGTTPVMFTSEGSFTDVNGDPINASIFLGQREQPLTANAITILGTTASVHHWRWNGRTWMDY